MPSKPPPRIVLAVPKLSDGARFSTHIAKSDGSKRSIRAWNNKDSVIPTQNIKTESSHRRDRYKAIPITASRLASRRSTTKTSKTSTAVPITLPSPVVRSPRAVTPLVAPIIPSSSTARPSGALETPVSEGALVCICDSTCAKHRVSNFCQF